MGPAPDDSSCARPCRLSDSGITSYTGNSGFFDCFYREETPFSRRLDGDLDRLLGLQERRHAIHAVKSAFSGSPLNINMAS
jgi:hypothetical protein